jgi:hypothetical protein
MSAFITEDAILLITVSTKRAHHSQLGAAFLAELGTLSIISLAFGAFHL